ncbi:DUF3017 domain-containing protein [Cumulibacter manganitolerans]|uniref:DUF3017 domain-containing protein n=1 Tax=Cumulibacter manganitolerans TaxID=1884992 RepID=UPI001296B88A|nr:DUF3017 domain-containing protein [Cumulibacter manganitolerans]
MRRTRPNPPVITQWRGGSLRQSLYIIVLVMLLIGLTLVGVHQWRKGLLVMGASMALAGGVRGLLPERLTGWLAVRNRTSDVVFCTLMAAALIVTALVARDS